MLDPIGERELWPRGVSREAGWFALVAMLLGDGLVILTRSGAVGSGAVFNTWSVVKHVVIVAGLVWLWSEAKDAALLAIAVLAGVVGAEEVLEITADIGKPIAEAIGLGAGELGVNSQFVGRILVAAVVGGPAVYFALRSAAWLRKAVYALLAMLGVLFVIAVGVDAVFDQAQRNIDEGLEEPLVSAMAALTIGLVVEHRRRLGIIRSATGTRRGAPRSRSQRRSRW